MRTIAILLVSILSTFVQAKQKMLVCGWGWDSIAIIDKETSNVDWLYKIDKNLQSNSICFTSNGNIAVANKTNLLVVSRDKKILWKFDAKKKEEILSVLRLKNGNLLLGICGIPARLVELDNSGKFVSEIKFDTKIKNIHGQFRQITETKNDTYYVASYASGVLKEIDKNGNIVSEVPTNSHLFAAYYLKNGNLILSGDRGKVFEFNPKTKELTPILRNLKDIKLLFTTTIIQLDSGNLLIGNWNGHSKDKSQPRILELDKDNNLVWKLNDKDNLIKNISSIEIFEE